MIQHPLILRALFFEKLASAFLTLGLPFIALVLVPVLAVVVRDYVRPADIEVNPPTQTERKPIDKEQRREIENDSAPDAISRAWDAAQAANDISALRDFIGRFPTSQYAAEARRRVNKLAQSVNLQLADAGNNVELIAALLENDDSNALDRVTTAYGLAKKYPLGFAVFYSDGYKVLSHGKPEYDGISFDTSALDVTIKDNEVCLNSLPVTRYGKLIINAQNICFGGNGSVIHAMKVDNRVAIDIESLGKSDHGAAWVIGMRAV